MRQVLATMAKITVSPSEKSRIGLMSEKFSVPSLEATKQQGSWRVTVRAGAAIASLVLLVNLSVLIWSMTLGIEDGSATIFRGSCKEMKRITFWVDLAVNILSTLLLGASNNCTQLLVAPTRKDIDHAHAAGRYLDVGVSSLRNFLAASRWRQWLCACLFLSSIPLHLLYNSVIFSTLSTSNYMAALVTDDFLQGAAWNDSKLDFITAEDSRLLANLQNSTSNLTRLENEDCIREVGTNSLQSSWRKVLVVSEANGTEPVIFMNYHYDATDDMNWVCGYTDEDCDIKLLLSHPTEWTIAGYEFAASVKYCLAEAAEQHCTVQVSTPLLGIVLLCNLAKVLCLASALCVRNLYPMATVGDLISSCLRDPDAYTYGKGPVTTNDVRRSNEAHLNKFIPKLFNGYRQIHVKHSMSLFDHTRSKTLATEGSTTIIDSVGRPAATPIEWKKKTYLWYQASSIPSWAVFMVLCSLAWSFVIYLLLGQIIPSASESQRYTLPRMWRDGVGNVSVDSLVGLDGNTIENALLSNTPQLAISFLYIFYNNCLTRMLLGQEYADYARHRKPLRVSRPEGPQRSTYRLQLPYRYSVPVMTAMAVLHWLVSRSIFLVQINVYSYDGNETPLEKMSNCGYSAMAIVLSLLISGVIVTALLANGARKLEPGMPLASSCSLAITAACHASPAEEDASLLPLKYGVVIAEELDDETEYEHACFSSKEVTPLVDGHLYI